jgi:thiol:disulfide interchange protein DsbG
VIWKDGHGKVNVKGGMPRLSELPGITGLPEQKNDDPQLARFR